MKKHVVLCGITLALLSVGVPLPDRHADDPDLIPDQYIVMLKAGANARDVIVGHGLAPAHHYSHAVHGFASHVPPGQLKMLKNDWRVQSVEPDRVVRLVTHVSATGSAVTVSGEALPTGVDRVDADLHPRKDVSSVGIAIIDTGVDLEHADLNVAGNVTFARGTKSGNDDNGHGSHVAGIAAAKADGYGVRGVAPNAKLYAVKVLDRAGSGQLSWVIAGVDWVTKNAKAKGIKVANMSLGFQGDSPALYAAISASVNAGVTYVVAAGNSGINAALFSPANHPAVITVSAIADSDGKCGGLGSATAYGEDDSFASFSNWGPVVDLAAPGVNILSTYKAGTYATLSGTSMASPHVAGAAAHYLAAYPTTTPAEVLVMLRLNATPQTNACGFDGDPDTYKEPLLNVKTLP